MASVVAVAEAELVVIEVRSPKRAEVVVAVGFSDRGSGLRERRVCSVSVGVGFSFSSTGGGA